MSDKERVIQLLDVLPAYKMGYVLAYVQGLSVQSESDMDIPNDETTAAFDEIENGGGTVFQGSTNDLFASLMEDDNA